MKTPRVCGVQIYKDNIKFSKTRNGKIIVIGKKYHFDMNIQNCTNEGPRDYGEQNLTWIFVGLKNQKLKHKKYKWQMTIDIEVK